MKFLLIAAMIATGWKFSYVNPEITVNLSSGATMEMVWIEPGIFTMGSPETEQDQWFDEGFWLGKYEIIQGSTAICLHCVNLGERS